MKAVIQAGGKGTRLRPYTLVLPKPLMPLGDHAVIESLIHWLRQSGVDDLYITTGYLGHLIKALCGNGDRWGMNIQYTDEPEPLGTIGALKLIKDPMEETFVVLNGDLISDLDLRAMMRSHRESKCDLTVATTNKLVPIDFGVFEHRDGQMTDFREKPTLSYRVSMGVYLFEPSLLDLIPNGTMFGFDHLIYQMIDDGKEVNLYEHTGYWMDIGRPEDFEEAQKLVLDQ